MASANSNFVGPYKIHTNFIKYYIYDANPSETILNLQSFKGALWPNWHKRNVRKIYSMWMKSLCDDNFGDDKLGYTSKIILRYDCV